MASGSDQRTSRRGLVALLVLIMGLLLGVNLVVVKLVLRASDPITVQALASVAGAAAMLAWARAGGHPIIPSGRERTAAVAVGSAMTIMSSLGISFGVERVDAGVAAVIMSTTPILTMVLSWVFLHEAQPGLALVGAALGMSGVLLVALGESEQGGVDQLQGVIFVLAGAGGWSLGLILMKTLGHGVSVRPLVGWQMGFGTPVLVVLALVVSGLRAEWTWWFVAGLLYMGILAKAVTFALQLWTLRLGSPVHASLTAFLMPVFGTAGGMLVLDERVSPWQAAGAGVVLLGVALVLRRDPPAAALPAPPA